MDPSKLAQIRLNLCSRLGANARSADRAFAPNVTNNTCRFPIFFFFVCQTHDTNITRLWFTTWVQSGHVKVVKKTKCDFKEHNFLCFITINNISTPFLNWKLLQFFSLVLLTITNVLLFNKSNWKILLPMILALKFYTVTIRCDHLLACRKLSHGSLPHLHLTELRSYGVRHQPLYTLSQKVSNIRPRIYIYIVNDYVLLNLKLLFIFEPLSNSDS